MLRAMLLGGASQEFEVDWANLVKGRTQQQARRRWRLMLKCVPDAANKEFLDVVKYLVETFVPALKNLLPSAASGASE
jgi:hypothetical protein